MSTPCVIWFCIGKDYAYGAGEPDAVRLWSDHYREQGWRVQIAPLLADPQLVGASCRSPGRATDCDGPSRDPSPPPRAE